MGVVVVVVSVSGQSEKEKGERGEWCRLSCLSTKRGTVRRGLFSLPLLTLVPPLLHLY